MKCWIGFVAVFLITTCCFAADPSTQGQGGRQVNLLSMGDWGNNGPKQRLVAATMKKYIESAAADPTPRRFSAMLLAGDNFYVPLADIWDGKWKTMFEDLYEPAVFDFPFYPALGNHDYQQDKYKVELAYSRSNPQSRWKMPARWYRVDFPEKDPLATVLMLDSNAPLLGDEEWSKELEWIETELAKPRTAKWLICVAHHPLISNGDHGDNGVLQRTWGPLFKEAKVDFFIAGHDHDIQHLKAEGIYPSLLLVGGGGATTRPMRVDKRGPFSKSSHGFADIELTDRRARVRLVSGADGAVLHEYTRMPDGHESVIQSTPSDVAVPRTVKSITRGGTETTTQKSKEKED